MPVYKAELSVSSLDALLNEIESYKRKVEDTPQKIVSALADYGKEEIAQGISDVRDKDGNYLAKANAYVLGNTGFAYMSGEQAAFLEYGTGINGKSSPHPKANEAGWSYGSGTKIRLSGYWSYYDKMKGKWRSTRGIPAQMPVLKAALAVRARIRKAAREALE